jgi:SAM-dependent methyltransferase
MTGDFAARQKEQTHFFDTCNIKPSSSKVAIDLGAGHGVQSVALAKVGFKVIAIDFSQQLLAELAANSKGLAVEIINGDFRQVKHYSHIQPELIICWGDTLSHLDTEAQVRQLLRDCAEILPQHGKLVLSFRDYSNPLTGNDRFIPVKSDETKILACFLEYTDSHVRVTDILYEKMQEGWQQKVSAYNKVRLFPHRVVSWLHHFGLTITFNGTVNRLKTIIAEKPDTRSQE